MAEAAVARAVLAARAAGSPYWSAAGSSAAAAREWGAVAPAGSRFRNRQKSKLIILPDTEKMKKILTHRRA